MQQTLKEPLQSTESGHEPGLQDIRAAAARIAPHVRRTPVLADEGLDEIVGARVFFKCENLQRGGSFKLRGATNAVRSLDETRAAHGVATHSSGNHGTALAIAARERGIPAYIVMPENSARVKIAAVCEQGATVILCKPGRIAREAALRTLLGERPLETVHPYDDYRVIGGQGTAVLEFLEQQPSLDAVLVPVGGGGLLSGTSIALRALRPDIQVIGAEPEQADDAYRSLRSGERVLLDAPDTIADGLRASLGERNFAIIRRNVDDIVRVSEAGIMRAARLLLTRLKVLAEPSSCVPVAALLESAPALKGKRVGIILTGGNVDLAASAWLFEKDGA
jgi:threonine dehydratase